MIKCKQQSLLFISLSLLSTSIIYNLFIFVVIFWSCICYHCSITLCRININIIIIVHHLFEYFYLDDVHMLNINEKEREKNSQNDKDKYQRHLQSKWYCNSTILSLSLRLTVASSSSKLWLNCINTLKSRCKLMLIQRLSFSLLHLSLLFILQSD
jgi:hypothetical protein